MQEMVMRDSEIAMRDQEIAKRDQEIATRDLETATIDPVNVMILVPEILAIETDDRTMDEITPLLVTVIVTIVFPSPTIAMAFLLLILLLILLHHPLLVVRHWMMIAKEPQHDRPMIAVKK